MTNISQSNSRDNTPTSSEESLDDRKKFLHEVIEGIASLSLPDEQFWADPRWESLAQKLEALRPPSCSPAQDASSSESGKKSDL